MEETHISTSTKSAAFLYMSDLSEVHIRRKCAAHLLHFDVAHVKFWQRVANIRHLSQLSAVFTHGFDLTQRHNNMITTLNSDEGFCIRFANHFAHSKLVESYC